MPDQALNLTAMRTPGHWHKCFASFFKGNLVASGSLTATPTFPATALAISVSVGSASNIKPGMRVVLKTAGGVYKGETRVRYSGTISSTNLPIRELSRGTANVASGNLFEVWDTVRLSDKLVTSTNSFDPDGLAFTDEGSDPPPIATSGGAWAGWTTMLPLGTDGSSSSLVDPDSSTAPTHVWTLPSGLSFASGTSTSADPTITGDAGEYEVSHAVTDGDNSETITQYLPVRIHDADDPPYDCLVQLLDAAEDRGWTAGVRVFGTDLSQTAIPDGCLCVVWKEEYIAGTRQSFGSDVATRSHVLMVGYVRREVASADTDGVESLEFEILSPLARLEELVGYSKVMLDEATPESWREVKTLSTRRAKTQLVQFYTNLIESGIDLLYHSNYVEYAYPRFYLQRSTPLGQLRELADGVDARLVCLRSGRFELHTHPAWIPSADRAALTVTLTLQDDDVIEWSYTREHGRPVDIVECRGFSDGSDPQPLFARWPGLAPGEGTESVIIERLIADTQSDLNDRAGRRGAAIDGIVQDGAGIRRALDLDLTLRGSYDVFDFYCEYVALDWTTARRELDLSDDVFYLVGVSIEFDEGGTARTRLRLRTATDGANGASYRPPSEDENGLPPFDPPDVDFPDGGFDIAFPGAASLEGAKLYKGTQRIAAIYRQGFALTTVFGSGMATAWTLYDHTASPFSMVGNIVAWIPDGFAPGKGWVLTDVRLYYVDFNALTATDKLTWSAAGQWGGDASFAQQNHAVFTNGNIGYATTDNATFNLLNASDGLASGGSGLSRTAPAYVSSHQSGYGVLPNRTSASNMQAYASDDAGVTWALLSNPLISATSAAVEALHYPWHDNAADALAYYSRSSGGAPVLLRDNSGSPVDITPTLTSGGTAILSRGGIGTYVGNRRRLYVAKFGTVDEVWVSDNGHAASPTYTRISAADYNRVFPAGDNPATAYLVGFDSGKVALVTDGLTPIEQTGNILTDQPTWDDAIAVAGY